jgi:hypothetical protein
LIDLDGVGACFLRHEVGAVQATGAPHADVPVEHARNLFARGSNLIFVNFSDEGKGFPTGTQPLEALGYIRLWK